MSWINQTIQFCTGAKHAAVTPLEASPTECYSNTQHYADLEDDQALARVQAAECAREIKQLWLSECTCSNDDVRQDELTPQQHGVRLLQMTKAKALRRIWHKETAVPQV
jgi:hypothetical protein